jgi:hypothetical protein
MAYAINKEHWNQAAYLWGANNAETVQKAAYLRTTGMQTFWSDRNRYERTADNNHDARRIRDYQAY